MSRKQHSKSPEGGKGTKSIRGPVSRSGRLELSRKWGGERSWVQRKAREKQPPALGKCSPFYNKVAKARHP